MCQGAAPLIALWIAGYSLVFLSAAGSGATPSGPCDRGSTVVDRDGVDPRASLQVVSASDDNRCSP